MRNKLASTNDKYILNDGVKILISNFLCPLFICNCSIAPSIAQIIVQLRMIGSLVNNESGSNVEGRRRGLILVSPPAFKSTN